MWYIVKSNYIIVVSSLLLRRLLSLMIWCRFLNHLIFRLLLLLFLLFFLITTHFLCKYLIKFTKECSFHSWHAIHQEAFGVWKQTARQDLISNGYVGDVIFYVLLVIVVVWTWFTYHLGTWFDGIRVSSWTSEVFTTTHYILQVLFSEDLWQYNGIFRLILAHWIGNLIIFDSFLWWWVHHISSIGRLLHLRN